MHVPQLSDPEFLQQSEKYWFYAIVLSCICYGLNLTLFFSCSRLLILKIRSRWVNSRVPHSVDSNLEQRDIYTLVLAFLLFGFATASMISVIIVGKGAFHGFNDTPGGPAQYLVEHVFQTVTTLRVAYIGLILCHVLTSGILIRSSLIIQKFASGFFCTKGPVWHGIMMSLPFSLLFASVASGIVFVTQILAPSKLSEDVAGKDWVLIWGAIATALSWELISVITVCLVIFKRSLLPSLGKHLQIRYTGIITILLESVGLLSLFSIFFMVAYSVKSPSLVMVPFLLFQVQVTSPLLVLYRVTSNRMSPKDAGIVEDSVPSFARNSTINEDRESWLSD